jgi:hypothetical protein
LVIDSASLEFGEVWGGRDYAISLPIQNVTDRTIRIDEFQTPCDCKPVEPRTLTIPPGETREIQLRLDPVKQPASTVGQPRRIDTSIRAIIHGRATLKAWKVRGTIRPPIATDMPAVLFGESNRAGQPPLGRRLKVSFQTPGIAKAELVPAVADVRVVEGQSSCEWTVVVTPRTDRAPGPYRGTLTISNISPDGLTAIASLELPVDGILKEADK